MGNVNCPKCHGKGFYMREDRSVQTCYDCLADGSMDQHDEHLKDANMRI